MGAAIRQNLRMGTAVQASELRWHIKPKVAVRHDMALANNKTGCIGTRWAEY